MLRQKLAKALAVTFKMSMHLYLRLSSEQSQLNPSGYFK